MARNRRSVRISQNRQAVIDAVTAGRGAQRLLPALGLSSLHVFSALLFALIALLPVVWGVSPVPYHLGQVVQFDRVSRVSFAWQDPEEERRELESVERSYARRYAQEQQNAWLGRVHNDIWALIETASRTEDANALAAAAKAKGIDLSAAQAEVLLQPFHKGGRRVDVWWEIIYPMQDVLRETIYRRGLMNQERYRAERGQRIQIIEPDREPRIVRVSASDPQSPLEPTHLESELDRGFARMPFSLEFRTLLRNLLLQKVTPSLRFEQEESQRELDELKRSIVLRMQQVEAGRTRLLQAGDTITPASLDKLRTEIHLYRQQQGWSRWIGHLVSKGLLVCALVLAFCLLLVRQKLPRERTRLRIASVAGAAMAMLWIGFALAWLGLPGTLLPIGLMAGMTAYLLGTPLALAAVTLVQIASLVVLEHQADAVLSGLGAGWLFAILLPGVRHTISFISSASAAGVLGTTLAIATGLSRGEFLRLDALLDDLGTAVTGGYLAGRAAGLLTVWILTGVVILLALPLLESVYRLTTNVRLQELQDPNHPLLRQLVIEAPGSYHHSVIVGTLAEAAAEAIGANALLAKVGSYYHDIGKLMKPEYFSENESGISRHDTLRPTMSALIIMAHVKDGAEMARECRLPPRLIDIIEQHHGTGLIAFFYDRAKRQNGGTTNERDFRYPGPTPQFPEAALVMLADSVEAATRSLRSPSPAHLRKLVHDLLYNRFSDLQIENAGLTMTDLARVEDVFFRVLTSMFHSRVQYPGQVQEGTQRLRRR